MPASAIRPGVLKELQRQVNQELGASHAYLSLAAWCHGQNLKGFARYFSKQSAEERGHAQKLAQHLLDRGSLPHFGPIPQPPAQFSGLLDVARQALAMEQANSAGIDACYTAALGETDYPAQVLLKWFINEQVEEENWAVEMVERVERAACAGGV